MSKMINLGEVAQVTRDIYLSDPPDSLGGPCEEFFSNSAIY